LSILYISVSHGIFKRFAYKSNAYAANRLPGRKGEGGEEAREGSAMAETALGMATTLVGSALDVASSAVREEMGLLLGVQDDIWYIVLHLIRSLLLVCLLNRFLFPSNRPV
jgi:disease resistance protein RPM1